MVEEPSLRIEQIKHALLLCSGIRWYLLETDFDKRVCVGVAAMRFWWGSFATMTNCVSMGEGERELLLQ